MQSVTPHNNKYVSHTISMRHIIKKVFYPVAALSIALYVLRRFMSASDVAPEVTILSSAL